MITTDFFGYPKLYNRISWAIAIYTTTGIYCFYTAIKYFFHNETSLLAWQPILVAFIFASLLARYIFLMMMFIDGQFYRKKLKKKHVTFDNKTA